MKLSEKLIKLRKEKGLSQEEFGNEINVSRQAVSKWENGETKPDTDKIQEIVKKFNITYEYLLDDEIENMEQTKKAINKKSNKKIVLKVILTLVLLYLLFCIYKFIAFYRFYLIANSFSEENYMMIHDFKSVNSFNEVSEAIWDTTKVGNKIIEKAGILDQEKAITEEGYLNYATYGITFIDKDRKIAYDLNYDREKDMYEYSDMEGRIDNEEEYYDTSRNELKETTFGYIPSSFKEIFLASINPNVYYVSIINREFRCSSMSNDLKTRIQLNNDYLVQFVDMKQEFGGYNGTSTFSYDYVQDHFKEIQEPLETYKDKIIFE